MALEMLLDHKPQKPGKAFIACKTRAGKYPLQLPPDGLSLRFDWHHYLRGYLWFSYTYRGLKPRSNPFRLLFTGPKVASCDHANCCSGSGEWMPLGQRSK